MTAACIVNDGLELAAPGETLLLDLLRDDARLTGTKLACGEGDCGSCTVLVGELRGGAVVYRALCACLLPMAAVHGTHVVTVEGLPDCGLQDLLIEEGAVQCGFCTPGLLMSLAGQLLNGGDPAEAVVGNLCRCTGGPAIQRVLARLPQLRPPRLPDAADRLRTLAPLDEPPGSRPVAGGTDAYVARAPSADDRHLACSQRVERTADGLRVPAATTVEQLRSALPEVHEALARFGSAQLRHRASVGGNLAGASPIADLSVILLALGAAVVLRDATGAQRTLPLEDFWTGYRTTALRGGELIDAVLVPALRPTSKVSVEKVSRRAQVDVASVNSTAVADVTGGVLRNVRISAGGVAPRVVLLPRTAAALDGIILTAPGAVRAARIAEQEVAPISDARGSADYKRLLLRQLVIAHVERLLPGTVVPGDLP